MTSPLSPEAVAQMVADRKNAMTIQDALETLSAMASVQDGYAKKATDPGLKIIHKANAKAQRKVSVTIATLAAENATLRAENEELDFLRHEGGPDSVAAMETELATLRASEAAALERVAALTEAAQALGAMPEGYCFCSKDRIGDDSKIHEPECHDLRAVLGDK